MGAVEQAAERPALRLAGEAVARGDLKAIGPLIKRIDRIDRHQGGPKPHLCTEDGRKRLVDWLNFMAANLADDEAPEAPEPNESPEPRVAGPEESPLSRG